MPEVSTAQTPLDAPWRVVGLMSGTSHDGIDAAAAEIRHCGDTLVVRPLGLVSAPYDPGLRRLIVEALPPSRVDLGAVCDLDSRIGQAFADAARRAIDELCSGAADLVTSHGQTLFHRVKDGQVLGSLQLGQPAWIAEATGCPVVSDLRARDIAAGGQGAPLVSVFDVWWLSGRARRSAALNLGGIANVTVLGPDAEPIAFDTGPANALLDAAVVAASGGVASYDIDGSGAARGHVDEPLLGRMLAEPYYAAAPPKSTGKELFTPAYLRRHLDALGRAVPTDDVLATLVELTARTVSTALLAAGSPRQAPEEIVVAGGGTRNPTLMRRLRELLPGVEVLTSDDLGVATAAKEAIAFAVLGYCTMHGIAATLPSCTGARHPSVLGSITPGRGRSRPVAFGEGSIRGLVVES